jgi:hypothetical protein
LFFFGNGSSTINGGIMIELFRLISELKKKFYLFVSDIYGSEPIFQLNLKINFSSFSNHENGNERIKRYFKIIGSYYLTTKSMIATIIAFIPGWNKAMNCSNFLTNSIKLCFLNAILFIQMISSILEKLILLYLFLKVL